MDLSYPHGSSAEKAFFRMCAEISFLIRYNKTPRKLRASQPYMNIIIIFLIPTAFKPMFLQGITVITHPPKVPEFST